MLDKTQVRCARAVVLRVSFLSVWSRLLAFAHRSRCGRVCATWYECDGVQFVPRLTSLKRYFLLHEGDFLVHFLDLAEPQLSKPMEKVTLSHLQSLLDLAVRSSIAASDPFKVCSARAHCLQALFI